jgi:hypothetical protein
MRREFPAFAEDECIHKNALSARCKSVPGLVATQQSAGFQGQGEAEDAP